MDLREQLQSKLEDACVRQRALGAFRLSFAFVRTAAFCAALAAFRPCRRRSAGAIPDSLTDREFWSFFTTMSEEGGSFPSENFVSNEKTYQYVIPTLQRTLTPHGVYLGVGPEQNFTYIVNLEPRLAVIFDIRRQNAMLHLMYKAMFELSPTRAEFVSRLFSRPLPRVLTAAAAPADIFGAISTIAFQLASNAESLTAAVEIAPKISAGVADAVKSPRQWS